MSDLLNEKSRIIREIAAVYDLLTELHDRLAKLPHSRTACRELKVISTRISLWQQKFQPGLGVREAPPDREEIIRVLKLWNTTKNKNSLTAREQYVLQWLDKNTLKAA